jgi:uncharacterized protein (TIGR00297 family)
VNLAAALALAAGIGAVGAALRWLTWSGAVAATVVGGTVLAATGLVGGALLALFFVSGSLLTYALPLGAHHAGARTWRQVVANGGWAALGAATTVVAPGAGWALLTGALAAAQADTWGTEIGGRSRIPPRLVRTGRSVPVGTSGAVSALGTTAGIAGAVLMAGLGLRLGAPVAATLWGAAGGIAGMLADSVLGATVQATYHCARCGVDTERRIHHCGEPGTRVGGWPWIDNDVVNALGTGLGGAVALAGWALVTG